MSRVITYLFLFLYCYNLAGYLVVFSVRQGAVRSEMKKMLKESVPQAELIQLAFHTPTLNAGGYPLQWIEAHEFRYQGSMFDIVRTCVANDTTYFFCVNDVQEEALFADLDSHVQREMGKQGGRLDAFKDIFKNSYRENNLDRPALAVVASTGPSVPPLYESVVSDVASPPPRLHAA